MGNNAQILKETNMSTEAREWRRPGTESEAGIDFIRPSKLSDDDNGKVLVEGTFIESIPNHFDETKLDFKFEREDGNVIIINGAGNLGYRMKAVNSGDIVQVTYQGKQEIQNGKMRGKLAHNFDVLVGN
jgi:hypothetical protein